MQRDNRSPLARGRDKWLKSDEGQRGLATDDAQQKYLKNRLECERRSSGAEKSFVDWVLAEQADIVCIQETKAQPE